MSCFLEPANKEIKTQSTEMTRGAYFAIADSSVQNPQSWLERHGFDASTGLDPLSSAPTAREARLVPTTRTSGLGTFRPRHELEGLWVSDSG